MPHAAPDAKAIRQRPANLRRREPRLVDKSLLPMSERLFGSPNLALTMRSQDDKTQRSDKRESMMLKSVRFGCNDLDKARAFYDATFAALGAGPSAAPAGYPMILYNLPGGARFLCGPARDGEPATAANGGTVIFEAPSEDAVKAWHAAGLANGGSSEGDPEAKPQARGAFGAYLRDPDGNKICAYHGLSMG